MVLAGYTVVGEFHYVHHAAGRPPLRRPERHGQGADQRGARGRHPDHAARHLLPRGRAHRRAATCRSTRCSSGSPTATSRPGPSGSTRLAGRRRPCGSAPRCTRCGPCRATTSRSWASSRPRDGRPLHVHLSEQPGENLACEGFYGCSPDRAARRGGPAHARDDGGARNPPVRQRHRAARRGPGHRVLLPDHRARPRRRHRPGPRAARRRGAAVARLRPARRHRPVRGGARRRDARAAREPRARAASPAPTCSAWPRVNGYRSLGWDDGGVIASGHLADLVAVRLDSPRTAGCGAGPGALRGDLRRRHRRRRRAASTWCATAGTGRRRRVGCSPTRSRRCAGDARERHRRNGIRLGARHRHRRARHLRRARRRHPDRRPDHPAADRLGIVRDAAVVVVDGLVAWVGPAADGARGRPARRRRRPRRRARLRRQPQPPRLRRRPGGRVQRPDGRRPLRRRRHRRLGRGDPGRERRRAARACCGPGSPRCARSARRPSRSRAATG